MITTMIMIVTNANANNNHTDIDTDIGTLEFPCYNVVICSTFPLTVLIRTSPSAH